MLVVRPTVASPHGEAPTAQWQATEMIQYNAQADTDVKALWNLGCQWVVRTG